MYSFQLKIIEFIQQVRSPILDDFFKFWNFFDTEIFFLIFIPIIWIGYRAKFGIKIFFILMFSSIVNTILKNLFMLPRPYILDPTLGVIQVYSNYGMPSGAAQTAILLPLIFIHYFKGKKWPIIIGINFFFWMSLSRLYLGVHFLTDVIAGWIVGGALFLVYLYLFPLVENLIKKYKPSLVYWVYQIAVLSLFFVSGLERYFFVFSAVVLGYLLSKKYKMFLKDVKSLKESFKRSVFALLGVFFISFLAYILKNQILFYVINISYYLIGIWISFFCSYFYKKLLTNQKRS